MNPVPARLPLIDALKAAASQLIVLHHLAFYGPMSDAAYGLAPSLFDWLYEDARIAVQVFFVAGGYLSARSLAPRGGPTHERPLTLVWNRYCRLVAPLLAAIGLAVVSAAIARAWMQLESIPAVPTAPQLLAHALLLQNLLGYEALSAGVWYVAIDLQLFALMVALLWLPRRVPSAAGGHRLRAPAVVSALAAASLFYFNRDAGWDDWALYFFGAYGLGALAFWASARNRAPLWLAAILAIGLSALLMEYRIRIAVALLVALLLGFSRHSGFAQRGLGAHPIALLGRISYSVFLVHYPVCLVVNAAFARFAPDEPIINAFGLVLAWIASILAGSLFYRHVEQASGTWLAKRIAGAR